MMYSFVINWKVTADGFEFAEYAVGESIEALIDSLGADRLGLEVVSYERIG